MAEKKIRVRQVKGLAGCKAAHRATVRGLGLKRLHHCVEVIDTPAVRGMITAVHYLVRVEA